MVKSNLIKKPGLIISSLILITYFVIRLINQSKIMHTFPLDYTNDWSSYIAQAYFLKVCGFHNFCPYWYNGFVSFLVASPGWQFFVFPIDMIINNIAAANYIALIITLALSLIASFKIGQVLKFSRLRSLALFALFFGNAIAIGNFIRLGRVSSALSFMLGLWITYFILKYKDQKITPKFLLIIPIYAALILTHYEEAFLFSLLPLCLLIYKKDLRERIIIILTLILSVTITLFWSYPFLLNLIQTRGGSILLDVESNALIQNDPGILPTVIVSYIIPIIFMIILIIRVITSKNYSLLKFYSPIIILAAVFLSRLNMAIPILRNIYPDPIIQLLMLFSIILVLEIKVSSNLLKILATVSIILISLISVTVSHIHTPYFIEYTPAEYELLDVLGHTPGHFIMLNPNSQTSYAKAYYSLAAIKYNLTTPSGWYEAIAPQEQLDKLVRLGNLFQDNKCDEFIESLKDLKTDYVIGYAGYCEKLRSCGLKIEYTRGNACLFNV